MSDFDLDSFIQERVAKVTAVFGQPRSDAQRQYLERKIDDLRMHEGCYDVAARAYAVAFGTKRFPDIDVLGSLASFFGGLADGGHDTFNAETKDEATRELLRRMSAHCAELATVEHARELAKGDVAVEKMKKFGRALLGTASSITPRPQ
jgi:hypothetical protein